MKEPASGGKVGIQLAVDGLPVGLAGFATDGAFGVDIGGDLIREPSDVGLAADGRSHRWEKFRRWIPG